MQTTTTSKRKGTRGAPKEMVLSVRLDADTVAMLDELALEMERSRSNLAARAIRAYVEEEYDVLARIRQGQRDAATGRTVSTAEARAWLRDRIAGKKREPRYGK